MFLGSGCFLFKSSIKDKDLMFIADQNPLPCAPRIKEKKCWKTFGYKYENNELIKIEVQLSDFSQGGHRIEGQYAHVFIKELDRIKEENPTYERLCQFYEGQLIEEECHLRKKSPFTDYCEASRDTKLKTKLCSRYLLKKMNES